MRLLSSRARQDYEAEQRRSQQERLAYIADEMKQAAMEIEAIVAEIKDSRKQAEPEGGDARDV